MSLRPVPAFKRIIHGLFWTGLSVNAAQAAPNNCSQLDSWPTTYEVGQGLQSELRSPVPITQLAVGDPKIADVQSSANSSNNAFILTGVAPGTTSLMVWTACSKTPRQSMVFVKGKATAALTSVPSVPSDDPLLPSQVQTDIRFVEVSRTKLKEASASIFGRPGQLPVRLAENPAHHQRHCQAVAAREQRHVQPQLLLPAIPWWRSTRWRVVVSPTPWRGQAW
jgi:hypothetical protein